MAFYKQSTAYTRMFKMIDSADHFTKKTGLTCTVNISKAGAAFGAAAGTVTEVANGWYKVALTTADTNTVGDLAFYITASGADDTDFSDGVFARTLDDLAYPATSGRSIVVDAAGLVDANMVKAGPTGSGTAQTAKDIGGAVPAAAAGASGGLLISGSNAGTTTFGALTITGATTHTGNVVLSDGLTISAPSTTNRAGLDIAGNGTGAAIKAVAGATGVGLSVAGGGTSGDGVKVTTTSGHGVNLAPVGTSMHGFLSTGGNGGTSDGIKAVAGTGGVPIRGDITGNITGNLSGSAGSVTGAVGSVTGAVGSVTGAVGSVTARVTANTDQLAGQTVTAAAGVTFPASVASPTNITAGTITTATNVTTVNGLAANVITAASMAADAGAEIATAVWTDTTGSDFTTALSVGKSVMNGVTLGTGLTVAAVSGSVGSVTGAVGSVTGNVGGNVTGSVGSVVGAVGSVTGSVGSVTGAVGSVTGNVGGNVVGSVASVTGAVGSVTAGGINASDKTGYRLSATGVGDILTTALTESYSADGAAPTLSQAIFAIQQMMQERSIASTTLTVKKLDGTTTAMTYTLDSASSPTSITRAT